MRRRKNWEGRAGAIWMSDRNVNLWIVGVHIAHGECRLDSLSDLARLQHMRPWGSLTLLSGDLNSDFLPTMELDPWRTLENRSERHCIERTQIDHFASTFSLNLHLGDCVDGVPGGVFAHQALGVPFTRVPRGDACETSVPSLIDMSLLSPELTMHTTVDWTVLPFSDHACVVNTCEEPLVRVMRRGVKTHWRCDDYEACETWITATAPPDFDHIADAQFFMLDAMKRWANQATCRQRRRNFVPMQVRSLALKLQSCQSEEHASIVRKGIRVAWKVANTRRQTVRSIATVKKGGVIEKRTKLHRITAIQSGDQLFSDEPSIQAKLLDEFTRRWGSADEHTRMRLHDYALYNDGEEIEITGRQLSGACQAVRQRYKLDMDGLCVQIIDATAKARPAAMARVFARLLSDTATMSTLQVRACVFGKRNAITEAKDVRAIIPLSSILQVCDALIADRFHSKLNHIVPQTHSCFFGARPQTQTLEIAHTAHMVLEKGLDSESAGCVAQADIRNFYDSLPVWRIIERLRQEGFDDADLSALVRLQMFVQVTLSWSMMRASTAPVRNRSCGGLTGSRCAGFLGRCPLEFIARERIPQWKPWGFSMGQHTAILAVWVDNCYAFGDTVFGATAILNDLEHELSQHWGLAFKEDSKCAIVAEGAYIEEEDNSWPLTPRFECFGHVLEPTGSIRACFNATKRLCWNAFHLHLSSKKCRHIPIAHKITLLQRVVQPIFSYRCTRWPYQKTYAKELDLLQTKMLAVMTREQRYPDEELARYIKRRNQMASRMARTHGRWSRTWAKRVLDWRDHLIRPRNEDHLVARVFSWHGAQWLRQQRLQHGCTATSGRTRTRLPISAVVHQRWEEGCDNAMEFGLLRY